MKINNKIIFDEKTLNKDNIKLCNKLNLLKNMENLYTFCVNHKQQLVNKCSYLKTKINSIFLDIVNIRFI